MVMIAERTFHPVSEIFPLMDETELAELTRDIAENGMREAIWLHPDGRIVDGRNRYLACRRAGIEPTYRTWDGQGSLVAFVVSLNMHRRHLTESQRALIAAKIANLKRGRPGEKVSIDPFLKQSDAAQLLNVSQPSVKRAARVLDHGAPALVESVQSGRVAVSTAAALTTLPAPEQEDIVARGEREIIAKAKEIQEQRRQENRAKREARLAEIRQRPEPLLPLPIRLEVADAASLPLDDACVDLIVTSPPYGLEKDYGIEDTADDWQEKMLLWLREMMRVLRPSGRLALNIPLDTTRGGKRPTYAQAVDLALRVGLTYQFSIVWVENNISKSVARGSVDSPRAPHVIAPVEMIAVFCKGEWTRTSETTPDLTHDEWLEWTNGLWTFAGESRPWEEHPAAFPEELPRRLIRLLSFPGDTVLDPFLGSGTTAMVAHQLGRTAIGFDISPQFIASAKRRLLARIEYSLYPADSDSRG